MEKPVITSSGILSDLQAGLTRKDIQTKYGLNGVQLKEIFKSPSLKNKKTIKEKGAAFIFIDDVAGVSAPVEEKASTQEVTQLEIFDNVEEALEPLAETDVHENAEQELFPEMSASGTQELI